MPSLIELLQSSDPEVRREALAGATDLTEAPVARLLASRLADDRFTEPERQLMAEVLSRSSVPEIQAILLPLLASENAFVRTMAALALGGQQGPAVVLGLVRSLTDSVNTVRNWAERSLIAMIPEVRRHGIEPLTGLLSHPTTLCRSPAARLLGLTQDERSLDPLMRMAREDAEWLSRMSAIRALGELGISDALGLIEGTLRTDPKNRVRAAAAEAIGKLRPINAEELLRSVLDSDDDEGVQKSAGEALRSLGFEVAEINDESWE